MPQALLYPNAQEVFRRRALRGLSIPELAAKCEIPGKKTPISAKTIERIEGGRRVRANILAAVARALKTDLPLVSFGPSRPPSPTIPITFKYFPSKECSFDAACRELADYLATKPVTFEGIILRRGCVRVYLSQTFEQACELLKSYDKALVRGNYEPITNLAFEPLIYPLSSIKPLSRLSFPKLKSTGYPVAQISKADNYAWRQQIRLRTNELSEMTCYFNDRDYRLRPRGVRLIARRSLIQLIRNHLLLGVFSPPDARRATTLTNAQYLSLCKSFTTHSRELFLTLLSLAARGRIQGSAYFDEVPPPIASNHP